MTYFVSIWKVNFNSVNQLELKVRAVKFYSVLVYFLP